MDPAIAVIAAAMFIVGIVGERLLLARRRVYRTLDTNADLGCGIGQQVASALLRAPLVGGYAIVFERVRVTELSPRSPLAWVLLLVLVDLSFYAFHRTSHRVHALWAAHAVHHQSDEYNFAVALRQSWLEPLFQVPFHLPLALLGFPTEMFVTALVVNALYQFWLHTRGVKTLGPLEWVLNTPSHHRVHHGVDPEYLDKNYGGMFVVWDRLFGTFAPERHEPTYGTVTQFASFNPVWANVAPWVTLARLVRDADGAGDKLRAVFCGPEWRPASLGGPIVARSFGDGRPKYRPAASRAVRRYASLVLVETGAPTIAVVLAPLSHTSIALAALAFAGLATSAGLPERRRWALSLEVLRVAALTPATALVLDARWSTLTLVAIASAMQLAVLVRVAPGAQLSQEP